ncbi:MAG: Ig-like domain-containing protein [Planctomycetota bacterium]|nr:Ig-like domain-containing protein [Planctomycetota bacterium]
MSHARRPVSGRQSKNRRCGLAVRAAQRRFSQFERLEDRNLLAGELLPNVWHNASDPCDVNVDARVTPVDLLVVINALNQGGSRGLIASDPPSPTTGGGEAESGSIQGMKIDVNADRALTPLDALMLIERLNAEAEPPQALVAISAFSMNDPPHLSIPNPITVPEGTQEVPLALNVTDSDVGAGTMQLTATVNGGTLTLGDASRLTYSSGGGTNNTSFSATGTLADIKAALNAASGTKFFPQSADYNGTAKVILTVDDLGNTGGDGAKQDTKTVTITVTPDNDAPINTVPGQQTVQQNAALVFSAANGNRLSVADLDGDVTVQTDLQVDVGTLTAPAFSGSGTARLRLTGKVSAVNAALASVAYTPGSALGITSLMMTTSDLGNIGQGNVLTRTDFININVVPPTLPYAGNDSKTVIEDSTNNAIDVLVNDLKTSGGTLSITHLNGAAVGSTVATTHGAVTLSGTSVRYTPTENYYGPDSFTYTIADSNVGNGPSTGTVAVTVMADNDAPTLEITGETRQVAEERTLALNPGTAFTVADIDADGGSGVQVDVRVSHGTLTVGAASGANVTHPAPERVVLTGLIVQVNGALNSLSYTPTDNYSGSDNLTVLVDDLGNTGGTVVDSKKAAGTVSITVTPVNDDPTAVNDYSAAVPLFILQDSKDNRIDVLGNDSFAPDINETLTIQSSTAGTRGTVTTDGQYVYYSHTPAAGPGTDQFTYTINDGHGGTATATVYVQVVDFVPSNVSGYVHIDLDGDGVKDTNELGVGNVPISLTGTNIQGTAVNLTTMTDSTGCYTFHNVLPTKTGTMYRITETQPSGVTDGGAHVGDQGGTVVSSNVMDVFLPMFSYPTGITGAGNNFVELGLSQRYASLYLGDLLHSGMSGQTGAQGMVFGVDATGNVQWFMNLGGWDGLTPTQVVAGKLNVTNTATGTVTQVSLSSSLVQSATDASGGMAYRLYGSATSFIANSGGEGEGGGSMAQYEQAVDALFAQAGTAL